MKDLSKVTASGHIDRLNIFLMLASCAAAYVLPFELLLFSYAFLGPAHYLTQISWMHDRSYFTPHKIIWLPASLLVLLWMMIWYFNDLLGNDVVTAASCAIYIFTFTGAVAIALQQGWKRRVVLGCLMVAFFVTSISTLPDVMMPLILLIPNVIHIYVFTGAFILLGALKSQSPWGMASFAIFLGCGALFLFVQPAPTMIMPEYAVNNIGMFDAIAANLAVVLSFGGTIDGVALLGFLGFAYTYHYLNWFSKAEVIKWNRIPPRRLAIIILLYAVSIGAYIYDYRTGFAILLFLSLLHVFLEFPLNALTFRSIFHHFKAKRPAM